MKLFQWWKRKPAVSAERLAPATGATNTGAPGSEGSGLLTGDAQQDARSLQILLDTIAAVTANIDLDSVLHDVVSRSLQVTQAERAILFLGNAADALAVRTAQDRDGQALVGDLQWSKGVVRRCLDEGQAVRSVVQSDREALELGQSVYDLKLRAVMCAPLVARNRIIGAIYVDSRAVRREFSARDLGLFSAISAQLAISLENARLHADSIEKVRLQKDFEIARRIQQHLMPTVPTGLPEFDLALRYMAASQASGDTYDFVPLTNGRLAVVIGDVTGHGIGAALLMHAAQAALRSYLELVEDLSHVVTRLNQRLVAAVETGNFMSLLVCVVDSRARTIRFVNGGHPCLIHCSQGKVTPLEKTGMVLGVVGGQDYAVSPVVTLAAGDLLFLHTDGVDEAMSPQREPFGEARLHALLRELGNESAENVLRGVERALRAHTGGTFGDDLTMIAVRLQ